MNEENNEIQSKQENSNLSENSKNNNNSQQEEVNTSNEEKQETNQYTESEDSYKSRYSIASLVVGIISILSSCRLFATILCAILAILFGITGLKSSKRGMSIAGIVTGAIGMVIAVVMAFVWISLGVYIFNNASNTVNSLKDVEDEINSYYEDYNYNYNTNTDSLYNYDYDYDF